MQKAINRVHGFDEIVELVETIPTRGFSSLNFDLIYGLPLQAVETIQETLRQVITLSPDRISYYNYAHLPECFAAQRAINAQNEVQLERYYQALDANQLPIVRSAVSGGEDALRCEIIQQLSCFCALDISGIERDYCIDFNEHYRLVLPELEQFERDGLIVWRRQKALTVTADGTLLLRKICMAVDGYLDRGTPMM